MARSEKDFQKEFLETFKRVGYTCYKIPDAIKSAGTRFTPEKPCDIFLADKKGHLHLVECKFSSIWAGLYIGDLRPNQIAALSAHAAKHGRAWVAYNISIARAHYCVLLDWATCADLIKERFFTAQRLRDATGALSIVPVGANMGARAYVIKRQHVSWDDIISIIDYTEY